MKKFLRNTLVGAVALCASGLASAAAVDFIDNGHYTTDTLSGLDWLDVTQSVNQSFNYVSSQFGAGHEYEGWRYATRSDFEGMITNFTGLTFTGYRDFDNGMIEGLIELLGVTHADTHTSSDIIAVYGWLPELIHGLNTYGGLFSECSHIHPYCHNNIEVSFHHENADYTYPNVGSFLVRDTNLSPVPVPAALPLFATALVAFGWFRRRKQLKLS